MRDPLHDLYQRLMNPKERTVEGQFAEGRQWAYERARQLCYYKLPHHFEWFNFYLNVVKQYSAGTGLKVSEGEARLVRESCAAVLAQCHEKLIERLQFHAKYSKYADEIEPTIVIIATALKGISDSSFAKLQRLQCLLRDETNNGTPIAMGGTWLPIPAPSAEQWVAKIRNEQVLPRTRSKTMRIKSRGKRLRTTGRRTKN